MVSRFLLLMALSVCVSGTLVAKVANSSYQAEVDEDLIMEWTFTPRPDSSLKDLYIFCYMFNPQKYSVLLELRKGAEVPEGQAKEFVGIVQYDKEVLREGKIRLHVSSLRTEDSGWYLCDVYPEYGNNLGRFYISVSGTLVVNVGHRFNQAELGQYATLEWTFTPRPHRSLKNLNISCRMFNHQKNSVLFELHEGVEVPQKEGEFVGRVHYDKEVLKGGRIRLHVSSLRIEDSGLYLCEVDTEYGSSSDECFLIVSGKTALLVGLILWTVAALIGLLCVCYFGSKRLLRALRPVDYSSQAKKDPPSLSESMLLRSLQTSADQQREESN
ncbi:uncharacterized protein LOC122870174 isoform X10 [Xyrichtys novacula]|nr:uncharacterized protein LOC122870174 isoform X10 [Xyrichtys novacula]